jgi:hypothetical protein
MMSKCPLRDVIAWRPISLDPTKLMTAEFSHRTNKNVDEAMIFI